MIRNHMVDAIVSTGANIVDQDFFEALGFKHYDGRDRLKSGLDDASCANCTSTASTTR